MGMMSGFRPLLVVLVVYCTAGCRAPVTMQTWAPPTIERAAGKRVLVADIVGPAETAERLQHQLIALAPRSANNPQLVSQQQLQSHTDVQLASALDNVPSDVAMMHVARQQGIDLVLFGELIATDREQSTDRGLAVSWKLVDARQNKVLGGQPIRVSWPADDGGDSVGKDPQQTDKGTEHSNAGTNSQPDAAQASAIDQLAERSWRMMAPYLRRRQATLANPWVLPGSKEVRLGNRLARDGDWPSAERHWQEVFHQHPSNHAAIHNLALAAVAREDLTTAKSLAQQALSMHQSSLYEDTVVWVEQRQLDVARGFALPAPPEGWLFVREGAERELQTESGVVMAR